MNTPLDSKIEELRALSALLDEALTLGADAQNDWLSALPPQFDVHRAQLQDLLARAQEGTRAGLIGPQAVLAGARGLYDNGEALLPGSELGGYRLIRELGRGGMGSVWLAERTDGLVQRQVALKLPVINMPHALLKQRFERERNILAALNHPHIARLYDAGISAGGQPFFVMEYVQGVNIVAHCDAQNLSISQRLDLFEQVLDAVQHAHSSLVVHRDIKPANILVTEGGQVRLLDFGIAKFLTADEAPAGGSDAFDGVGMVRTAEAEAVTQFAGSALTPDYASPEQFFQRQVRTESDVYALGVLLFELVAGARPYRLQHATRAEYEALVMQASRAAPSAVLSNEAALHRGGSVKEVRRQIGADLDTVILKAMKPEPSSRYATAEAFARDLRRWRAGEPVEARPDSRWYRARRFVGRNRLPVGAAAVAVTGLAIGLGVALWQTRAAHIEAQTAQATEAFLQDLFKANSADQADPAAAQKTTARTLLDRGAARLKSGFNDAPEAKLRVYQTLIDLYRDLELSDQSYALQLQRLALLQAQNPHHRPELAAELIATGIAATGSTMGIGAALGYLTEAEQMLNALGDNESLLRGQLEVAKANQLDADNCTAVVHAQRGVDILRRGPQSEALLDGMLQLMQNMTYCKSDELALSTGQEAIAMIQAMGRASRLPDAYRIIAAAHIRMGQIDKGIQMKRKALDAAQAKHPPEAPPDGGTLNAAASLAMTQVGFAHPADALAVAQPLVRRALENLDSTDRDGLVSLMMQQASALRDMGQGAAAMKTIERTMEIMASFDAEDSQRVMALDRYADILASHGRLDQAAKVLDEATRLHTALKHDGTGQANGHIALRVGLALQQGHPDRAEQALRGFLQRQIAGFAVVKPQLEHRLLQAEIALAKRDWMVALEASRDVQERQALYLLPQYVRDLHARALLVDAHALKATGKSDESQASRKAAQAIYKAMLQPS